MLNLGIIAAIVAPIILDKLFGPGSQEKDLLRTGQDVTSAEAEGIRQRLDIQKAIQRLIGDMSEGGRPPAFSLNLRNPVDQGEFFSQIQPMGELNALMRLLGATGPTPTASAQGALGLGLGLQRDRQSQNAELAQLLLGLGGGGGGGSLFGSD